MRLAINGRFYAAAVTGVQRFAREITQRLCARTDVTLLLPRGTEPPPLPGPPRLVYGHLRGHAWEQIETPALARSAGCDVTLHLSGTLPIGRGTHVAVLHDVLPLTNPEWFSWRFARWYRTVLRSAAPRAAAIITVSEWSRREIVRVLGVDAARVHTIVQGIGPFAAPADPANVRAVRERFSLPDRFVLALGAGDPRKNIPFLSDVLAAVEERRGSSPPLVLVGASSRRIHGRGAGPRVDGHRLGRVSDAELRALYTAAAVVCFPSLAEGFGRAPLEALSCGTPAIAATYASAAETLADAALLLPLDARRWAEALDSLMDDAGARAAQLARSRPTLAAMSWDACAERVLEICVAAAQCTAPTPRVGRAPVPRSRPSRTRA